jgi:hypothetical protein
MLGVFCLRIGSGFRSSGGLDNVGHFNGFDELDVGQGVFNIHNTGSFIKKLSPAIRH